MKKSPLLNGCCLRLKEALHKNRNLPMSILFSCSLLFVQASYGQVRHHKNVKYDVAAYIWPSCHNDPRAQKLLWPDGIGEWQIIKKGTSRFPGHYQPKVPLWGYEMDDDPKVMEKWIEAATSHKINVFVFDWYWYDHAPFLESTLDSGFLQAKNNHKMKFYVMWADHDVPKNYWNPYKYGKDNSLLFTGAIDGMNDFKIVVKRIITQYFKQPNYYKIDGKPVFAIFSIENLMKSFGNNIEKTRDALNYFRAEVKKAGFPGLHLQWTQGGGHAISEKQANNLKIMGFNSIGLYNMGGRNSEDYIAYGTNSIKIRDQMDKTMNIPVYPCVSIGWDDTPRFPDKGEKDVVHYNKSATAFAALLQKAKEYADEHPDQPKLITINAWNEWVEGSYLLPDMKYGFDYLKAVEKVIDDSFDPYIDNIK